VIVVALALLGPAAAVTGLVVALVGARCDCRGCARLRVNGWRAIGCGAALVVVAGLLAFTP